MSGINKQCRLDGIPLNVAIIYIYSLLVNKQMFSLCLQWTITTWCLEKVHKQIKQTTFWVWKGKAVDQPIGCFYSILLAIIGVCMTK